MHDRNGFTLVELAVALMVIGLLIGGVLKGQELIENTRITRFMQDMHQYDAAVMSFYDSYNAIPGDMERPLRLPRCSDAPCNQVDSSTGDGLINNARESAMFWVHLQRAGYITNINEPDPYTGNSYRTTSPITSFGGHMIAYNQRGNSSYYTTSWHNPDVTANGLFPDQGDTWSYLSCDRIAALDEKMDDGKPSTGMITVIATSATFACMRNDGGTAVYTYDKKDKNMIKINLTALNFK